MLKIKYIQLSFLLLFPLFIIAQSTEIQYLSGTGADNTIDWEFFCSAGMNSGEWTTIPVPSCWEQQGFGDYNYGGESFEKRLNETGQYRYNFEIPASWKNKQINIVFDGVMTDALIKINGKQAGPVHQGAFYQFKYDITKLIRTGKTNQLEVLVKKHSDNESVSQAERKADYWIFGGIFRPVFLEAKPKENIQRVAIDARADGEFKADIYLSEIKNAVSVKTEIQSLFGNSEVVFEGNISGDITRISGQFENPKTWTPEFPNLYNAVFSLIDKNGEIIHQITERFGFRTIEVRESDGVYVNGERIKMKGVNRHSFHPKFGRTSSKAISTEVVNLIKDMNMNAVRMSHYPPDSHFLDVCDSLGLFVLDELAGWQRPSYDETVGRKLLIEMIERDVNHPSIIFWDNANEGGENNKLNDDFAKQDIQKREVLHPWQDFRKTNTLHYIDYNYLSYDGFSKRKIFFSTEFLHGLYDGGHGAGLDDYWQKMWADPLCAGGFLWVFADESVERTDRNRDLDSDGNRAPDGILGPYHEKEGSFFTIKEIWAPVFFENKYITDEFDGTFRIENRYHYTNLNQCEFTAEWVVLPSLSAKTNESVLKKEKLSISLKPGQKDKLKLELPPDWQTSDVMRIKAIDPFGRHINTWSWPVKTPAAKAGELVDLEEGAKPEITENENSLEVKSNGNEFTFSKTDGTITKIITNGKIIPLKNGPVFVSREKEIQEVTHNFKGDSLVISVRFNRGDSFTWIVLPDGLLELKVAYKPASECLFAGITFDYPEENVAGMKWLGNGPYRVYKNRMKGVEFGLWEKKYNNTITGESGFEYPEFKGYHSEVYWAEIQGKNSPDFKVIVHSNDVFLRMLTPDDPKEPARTKMEYPKGDISFLHGINATGSKFKEAERFGPQSSPYFFSSSRIHGGFLKMKLTFDFR
ncbi:MAG: beta-galactosidase [Mariniphaga sp.]|nr:beta-galactosidase [Mariniphaga sp.]